MKDEWDAIVANADGTSSSDTPAGDARYGDSDVAANVGEAGRGEAATALAAEDQSGRATTVAERHQADGQTNEQVVNEILDRPSAGDLAYDPFKGGIEPPWRAFQLPDVNEYHYYQVVMWKDFCSTCHATNRAAETIKLADSDTELVTSLPFVVVKVVVPFGPTKWNINKNRAMLVTTAIITVALAMGALYVVVRYVIVKPLTHLRDISDEIGRGNYALRAEIETNDEFEDLARSYNRMLRHLVEAQEKLRAVNANLDAKVDQLAQANMQLYEMNRLKSDFLANMSHELRT
ncbi:MAG: HAMP domain-containing protein, partial [Planctomycetales bacterium]|nr:HAMP domain-containing protein [Planctomycetales bacterium]